MTAQTQLFEEAIPKRLTEAEGLLDAWLSRAELAKELGLSVDTLQRWETRRIGPPCVRIGRKVLYRKGAVRDWLCDQEARKMPVRRRS